MGDRPGGGFVAFEDDVDVVVDVLEVAVVVDAISACGGDSDGHYASVLLEDGVSIRAVSEYLGHHDPGLTLRTYAHLMPESEDRARAAIDAALGPPAESSRNANRA